MRERPYYKRLDRYILGKYLTTFLLALVLIIVIVITFDVSEKLDKFISHNAPFHLIVTQYYFNFIPGFVNLYSPLFIFISVIFFTSKMAGNTEIVAILGSGVSYMRMLRPYLTGAIIVAVAVLLLGNFVIPNANRRLIAFEEQYVKSKAKSYYNNLHFQSERGTQIYAESYDVAQHKAQKFRREKLDDNGRLLQREDAELIRYDSASGLWHANVYFIRTIDPDGVEHLERHDKELVDFGVTPTDLDFLSQRTETMTTPVLVKYIEREKMRGTGTVKEAQIEFYQRLINPLSIIIMTLIGVTIASRKSRGGIGLHLAIGISLAFGLIVFMKVATVFAIGGNLSPFMAVLLPQLVFGIASLFLLRQASQ